MEIRQILEDKQAFLPLLLLGDEQESLIRGYLDASSLFALYDGGALRAVCALARENQGIYEIKNLAVEPACHRMGYGKALIDYVAARYRGRYSVLQVGTGDSPLTVPFYEKCGFVRSHRVENFFVDHYDHPIFECGVLLTDMVYLQKNL